MPKGRPREFDIEKALDIFQERREEFLGKS